MFKTAILTGPTATGKTGLSLAWAEEFRKQTGRELELINADSLLFSRGFTIGTAKPTTDELKRAIHHGIDIHDPGESFTAADFIRFVHETLAAIHGRGNRALLVGGTPFYLRALLFGMWEAPPTSPEFRATLDVEATSTLFNRLQTEDPESALKIGPNDRYRLVRALEILTFSREKPSALEKKASQNPADPRFDLWIIDRAPEVLQARIEARTELMLQAGWLQETQELQARFPQARELQSVGYRQVVEFLAGIQPAGRKIPSGLAGLTSEVNLATRQLVKTQRTFLRGLLQRIGPEASPFFHLPEQETALLKKFEALYHSP